MFMNSKNEPSFILWCRSMFLRWFSEKCLISNRGFDYLFFLVHFKSVARLPAFLHFHRCVCVCFLCLSHSEIERVMMTSVCCRKSQLTSLTNLTADLICSYWNISSDLVLWEVHVDISCASEAPQDQNCCKNDYKASTCIFSYQVIAENIHKMKIKFSVASSDITVTVITSRCLGVLV